MTFYKLTENGYILSIGWIVGHSEYEITEEEYNHILYIIRNKPAATETTDYRLREDLTWEAYQVEPASDPDPTTEDKAEAYDILIGTAI